MARRSNARQAKIALRKAALAEDLKPVRAGEAEQAPGGLEAFQTIQRW